MSAETKAELARTLWCTIKSASEVTGQPTRTFYKLVYSGKLRHTREGRKILIRLCDWETMLEAAVVEPGEYKPDPERQQAAVDRWAARHEAERAERLEAEKLESTQDGGRQ